MRNRIVVFVIISIFISGQAFCADIPDIPKWRKLFNELTFDANSKEKRQVVARGLLDHLTQLNSYIPNLKPAELEWIEQEEQALAKLKGEAWSQRYVQFVWTPEKHIRVLKSYLNAVTYSLNEIISNKKITPHSRKNIDFIALGQHGQDSSDKAFICRS